MTSSDRPKRPSARPSARPPAAPAEPPAAGSAADPGNAGRSAASAGGRRPEPHPAAKPNAGRISARRGAGAQEPAGERARAAGAPGDASGSERTPSAAKPRKARKQAPPRPATVPPAPLQPRASDDAPRVEARTPQDALRRAPESGETSAPGASARSSTGGAAAAHGARPSVPTDDGDDVFSAADPHPELLAELSLSAEEEADAEGAGAPGAPALSRLTRGSNSDRRAQEAALKGAQSLLSSDYYVRQYGAHGMRSLSADVDEYGLDPYVEERARPWLELLCTRYFRLDLEGARRIPAEGRALLVANRSGSVPWDGLMLHTALRMQRPELQPVRWLSEDSVIHYPFLGVFMNRLGAVRACPENAERLLTQDRLVAVFPEGAQGSHKLFKDRYRLQRFGRGGYVKLALKLGAPILPTAIIGAEETNPLLARLKLFGRTSGDEYLPITPTFPWLGPAGLLPAPIKWRVIIGEPVDLSAYGPDAAEDALVVHRLNEQIRSILQALLDQGTASRRSLLFG